MRFSFCLTFFFLFLSEVSFATNLEESEAEELLTLYEYVEIGKKVENLQNEFRERIKGIPEGDRDVFEVSFQKIARDYKQKLGTVVVRSLKKTREQYLLILHLFWTELILSSAHGESLFSFFLSSPKVLDRLFKVACFVRSGAFIESELSSLYLTNQMSYNLGLLLDFLSCARVSEEKDSCEILGLFGFSGAFSYRGLVLREEGGSYSLLEILEKNYKQILKVCVKKGACNLVLKILRQLSSFDSGLFLLKCKKACSPLSLSSPLLEHVLASMYLARIKIREYFTKEDLEIFFQKNFSSADIFTMRNLNRIEKMSLDPELKNRLKEYFSFGLARNFILTHLGEVMREKLQGSLSENFTLGLFYYLGQSSGSFSELKKYASYKYFLLLREEKTLLAASLEYENLFFMKYLLFWAEEKSFKFDKEGLGFFDYYKNSRKPRGFLLFIFSVILGHKKLYFFVEELLKSQKKLEILIGKESYEENRSSFDNLLFALYPKYNLSPLELFE